MNKDLLKQRLTAILIYQGFPEAALAIEDIVRGCSIKDTQDKVESWKAFDNWKSKN